MSGTDVESMAIKRCRRGQCVVATEKSLSSTSDFIVGAVGSLLPDAQTPYSVCPARRIGYNHRRSPAMVAGGEAIQDAKGAAKRNIRQEPMSVWERTYDHLPIYVPFVGDLLRHHPYRIDSEMPGS